MMHINEEGFPHNVDPEIVSAEEAPIGDEEIVMGVVIEGRLGRILIRVVVCVAKVSAGYGGVWREGTCGVAAHRHDTISRRPIMTAHAP